MPALAAAALLLWAGMATATNGYFPHGFSVSQKALGGAGTALVEDALIVSINPAGMVWAGDSTEAGLSLFQPIRDHRATARGDDAQAGIVTINPGQIRSGNELFPIPAFSYNRLWGERYSWGISAYGKGGMNTEYSGGSATFGQNLPGFEAECDGTFGGGDPQGADNAGFCGNSRALSGVDLAIMFIAPSMSMRLGEHSSIGIAPLLALSRFAAQGLGAFAAFSNQPDKVSDNGHELSYGGGYRIGFLTGAGKAVSLGASYQSRVWMQPFDDYAGLFAEQGDFDIPETWNAGVALHLFENWDLVYDYQYMDYNQVRSVGNPLDPNRFVNECAIPRLFASVAPGFGSTEPSGACLGAATGPGFGWQEMQVHKVGLQYRWGPHRLRAGYSVADSQPIPADEVLFNILAPGVIEEHFTAGISWRWKPGFYIEAAAMYAPQNPVRGKNPLSNTDVGILGLAGEGLGIDVLTDLLGQDTSRAFGADPDDQDIILNMRQYELTIGVAWRY